MTDCNKNDRRGIGSGVFILGLGLYFLAVNYDYLPAINDSWPVLIILVGIGLILGNVFRKRNRDSFPDQPGRPN